MKRSFGRIALSASLLSLLLGCGLQAGTAGVAPRAGAVTFNPAALATRSGYQVFYGIEHTHVAENGDDGQGTLAEAYAYARDKAKLDFLGVSSHSHMISDAGYAVLKQAASDQTRDGQFVALLAQEWSSISKGGHINIFEASERCGLANGDWDAFYTRWLPNHPEVAWVQFNHPHPSNPLEFGGKSFSPIAAAKSSVVAIDKFAGMALLNGPGKYDGEDEKGAPDDFDRGINKLNYEEEYKDFLNRGWHLGAAADQDNHVKNWGLASQHRTGVWARQLSRRGLIEAFQARRTFATNDHNLKLWLTANGAEMGGEVAAKGELKVTVAAADPDDAFARLELWADADGVGGSPAKLVAQTASGAKSANWTVGVPAPVAGGYVYAKVVYAGDRWGWTSPVWVR